MLRHLIKCQKYVGSLCHDPSQTVLTFGLGKSREKSNLVPASHRFNVEACRKALGTFVIIDEQPFKVVEGEGFKCLCKQLQPQFTIVSRHTMARDCFQLYLDENLRLKAFFKSNCSKVALTSDCWTSIQNLNYLALITYFIDNEWKY
uniref:AC9 transposase n=1 Tax=Cajanus cajan TaxID=3821 RepID=A0A151QQF2_CAJCA|nr:Putative AC9 transposase [Cajanus cajan]